MDHGCRQHGCAVEAGHGQRETAKTALDKDCGQSAKTPPGYAMENVIHSLPYSHTLQQILVEVKQLRREVSGLQASNALQQSRLDTLEFRFNNLRNI